MPDTLPVPDEGELLTELDSLRDLLREHGAGSEACSLESGEVLGILRLCPGLSLKQWPALAERYGLREWLALPMDKADFPFLAQIQEALAKLAYQTEHDPLTSLYNRRAFDRLLDQEIERTQRSGASLSLAILDLDDFKKINDTHGHPCGDEVLTALSRSLISTTRRYDVAARLGGEEFALLMPETGLIKSRAILERVLGAVRELAVPCKQTDAILRLTCSAGLVCYKGMPDTPAPDLVSLADTALYQAKEDGKDRVVAAPLTELQPPRRESIVESNEKKFLFTGS